MTDLREQEMQSQIDALSSTAENWKNTAKNLKTENQMLKAQVAQLQKMVYGSRTEKTKRILPETADGQLNLFNEAEVEAKRNAPEPCIEVPAHQRRKKQKDHTAELLAKFPHEERLITLPEEERVCKRCGTALTSMGKEKIRTEIEFIPAKVNVIDYYRESFQCLACRKEAHFSIEKPAMPQPVIAKSIASPSSVAHVMVQKYQQSMPLYRQEREWKEIGIPLSRATLANWVIRPAEDWLMPLVSRLQQDLLQQDVIHADETPVQVHKEKG
ncbi:IS66 family transposase, partial [Mitsuokella jalaludinii]